MKKTDVYEIATKLIGLFFVKDLIEHVTQFFGFLGLESGIKNAMGINVYTLFYALDILLMAVIVYLFVFKTKKFVGLICKSSDYEETITLSAKRSDLYEIVIRITGLLLIVWTLPDFILKLRSHIAWVKAGHPELDQESFLWAYGVKLVLACILLLSANGIAAYFSKNKAL
jgi:hypothetical protein